MTRGLILAAGRGSRMLGYRGGLPKCLVEIAGKTILQRQLDAYEEAGVNISSIALVTGYSARRFSDYRLQRFHNSFWATTQMVESLLEADQWLSSGPDTIVTYGDVFFEDAAIRALLSSNDEIAVLYDVDWISLWRQRFQNPLEDAESFIVDDSGYLLSIGQKMSDVNETSGQFMGLFKFSYHGWLKVASELRAISPIRRRKLDMTSLFQYLLDRGFEIKGIPFKGVWGEMDSQTDLCLYRDQLSDSF